MFSYLWIQKVFVSFRAPRNSTTITLMLQTDFSKPYDARVAHRHITRRITFYLLLYLLE